MFSFIRSSLVGSCSPKTLNLRATHTDQITPAQKSPSNLDYLLYTGNTLLCYQMPQAPCPFRQASTLPNHTKTQTHIVHAKRARRLFRGRGCYADRRRSLDPPLCPCEDTEWSRHGLDIWKGEALFGDGEGRGWDMCRSLGWRIQSREGEDITMCLRL